MPRQKNTRPTQIYWLVDTRTGLPFYCGKTVAPLHKRLKDHRNVSRREPHLPVSQKFRECDGQITIHLIETVPPENDWCAREKRWIEILRGSFPECLNVASGGEGAPGYVFSVTHRAKLSAGNRQRTYTPWSAESRAIMSKIQRGKPKSAVHAARIGEALRGRTRDPEILVRGWATRRAKAAQHA